MFPMTINVVNDGFEHPGVAEPQIVHVPLYVVGVVPVIITWCPMIGFTPQVPEFTGVPILNVKKSVDPLKLLLDDVIFEARFPVGLVPLEVQSVAL